MKRKISILLLAALAVQCAPTAFADNEDYHEYDVTMTVKNSVVNTTNERLFGVNMEWDDGDMRNFSFLDKNYDKLDNFANDFENKAYTAVPMETAEAYYDTAGKSKVRYIANGDKFTGNLSSTRYMVKSGADLYENQYDSAGNVQPPTGGHIEHTPPQGEDGYATAAVALKDSLVTGGKVDDFIGFNGTFHIALDEGYDRDIDDMTVVTDPQNGQNHAAKLAPYYKSTSFYGKNRVALMDRVTKTSCRIMIDKDGADFRILLAKDWNLEQIADKESSKYIANAMQFGRVYYMDQECAWFDAVRFKNGSVYLGGDKVGTYEVGKWYDVEYVLDTADSANPTGKLTVSSANGIEVDAEKTMIPDAGKNMCRDIGLKYTADFEFDENSIYGVMFAAYRNGSRVSAYLDDINFETQKYYDARGGVIEPKLEALHGEHVFPYARMAGSSAMSFNWKKSIGDVTKRERFNRDPRKTASGKTANAYGTTRTVWGLPEWLKTMEYLNPDAETSYVINTNDTDSDIIDLIEYLLGDGDINGDGTDWSAQRKADGITRKAPITMWEIANEPDCVTIDENCSILMDVDTYLKRAGEIVKILKKYAPDIPIAIPTDVSGNARLTGNTSSWTDDIVKQDWITDCDYIAIHSYQSAQLRYPTENVLAIEGWIKSDVSKNKNLKIAYTEHGTSQPSTHDKHWKGVGLCSAIDEANFYNCILSMPIVDRANSHSFNSIPGPWGYFYEKDGAYYPTATYRLLDMYAKNAVGDVLDTEMTGFERLPSGTYSSTNGLYKWNNWWWDNKLKQDVWRDGAEGYTCSAVKQADGSVNLFISNQRNHKLNLNLVMDDAFDGYEICEKQVITGKAEDTLFSYDGTVKKPNENGDLELEYAEDMVYETDYDTRRGNIEISPYSVTMLKLKKSETHYVAASWNGEERIDVSGKIINPAKDRYVTLLITDKADQSVKYIDEAFLNENNEFRFNFLLGTEIDDCDVKIRYAGSVKNIGGEFEELTDSADLFGITAEITPSGVTAFVNNKYNFLNVWFTMIASGYKSYDRTTADGVSISERQNAAAGESTVTLDGTADSNMYRLYFWDSANGMKPIFGSMTVNR